MTDSPGRIMVTGAFGFVGSHLLPALTKAFPEAEIAVTRYHPDLDNEHHADNIDNLHIVDCDLVQKSDIERCIAEFAPDCLINLAAQSHIPTAWQQPEYTWQVNQQAVLHMLNEAQKLAGECLFLQIGSGDCYGESFKLGHALDECTAMEPLNPYAASKAAADLLCGSYRHQAGIRIVRMRPFNHSGARQSRLFVISAFAEQIARIEAGLQPPAMSVGNLEAKRSFLHVDDVVAAYLSVIQQRHNIASGEVFNVVADDAIQIQTILHTLLAASPVSIEVVANPELLRPSDIPIAAGSNTKLKSQLGWQPRILLEDTLHSVLNYWREVYEVTL